MTTVGVCLSLQVAPPAKRMRRNAQGREEAIVLNSEEQMEAANARLRLRQQQGDMKKVMRAARQSNKAAERALSVDIKKVEKAVMDTKKAYEKASATADKAKGCVITGDRKAAAVAAATTHKAVVASHAAWRSGAEALVAARAALVTANRCCQNLSKHET